MGMEHRKGRKIELTCFKCKKIFLRPENTIRKVQKQMFCSRECLKKDPKVKAQAKRDARNRWNAKNRDFVRMRSKIYRDNNIESVRESRNESYKRHAKDINERKKKFRKENPDIIKIKDRERYIKNAEKNKKNAKEYRRKNPGYTKKCTERYRKNNRASLMLSSIKKTAKNKKVKFDLTKEWMQSRLNNGSCEMSGIAFDLEGKRTPNSPSIDRIIPGGDYTQNNCRMILWCVNKALSNLGEDYILNIFKQILKRRNK